MNSNYLAADIAQFTSTGTGENAGTLDLIVSATQYHHVFQSILFVTIGVFVLGLLVDFKHRKQATI